MIAAHYVTEEEPELRETESFKMGSKQTCPMVWRKTPSSKAVHYKNLLETCRET